MSLIAQHKDLLPAAGPIAAALIARIHRDRGVNVEDAVQTLEEVIAEIVKRQTPQVAGIHG